MYIFTFTKEPITPRLVNLKCSKFLHLLALCKNGYKYNGICALRNNKRVLGWEPIHCNKANALQSRVTCSKDNVGGFMYGYVEIISYNNVAIVPVECHNNGPRSWMISRLELKNKFDTQIKNSD